MAIDRLTSEDCEARFGRRRVAVGHGNTGKAETEINGNLPGHAGHSAEHFGG